MIDLRFEGVSKVYRVRQQAAPDEGAHPLVRKWRALTARKQEFFALRDVSFGVGRGEAVGIIGHNGAGKSTILKLLSNITAPTSGEITITGRLSALIEVGSGFHPELTGRENVYLSGSILGMRRAEISSKLDQIVDFAGVRQFIDTPVKRYSSGMYVRLGFSIAAHLEPDILLLDEVLAVGDASFQQKCLERIDELKRAGTTIVFISHDLGAVERLCDRVLLMHKGELAAEGAAREVIRRYEETGARFRPSAPRHGQDAHTMTKEVELVGFAFRDAAGRETTAVRTGDAFTARVEYFARERVADAVVGVFLYAEDGELACQLTTEGDGPRVTIEEGAGAVEFSCAEMGLQPGRYYVDLAVEQYPKVVDWQYHCASLLVEAGRSVRGRFYMPHGWRLVARPPGGERYASQTVGGEVAANDLR